MNQHNYVVIMAGGVGSRFWPYSRTAKPKQFLDILNTGRSLIQMTFDRFRKLAPAENIYIVTNEDYAGLVAEQLPEIDQEQILTEPVRRNTAPCVAYATYKIRQKDPSHEACMIVAPSDHAIFNEDEFISRLELAMASAREDDRLVTMGIQPTRPETGYGYIQYIPNDHDEVKQVKTFTEKPQLELAETFIQSGDFVWNAGIFIWSVPSIVSSFEKHMPDMAELFEEACDKFFTDAEQEAIKETYALCKSISIDYGVMEHAENVFTVLGDFGWTDLGSWASLHEQSPRDENENAVSGNVLIYDTKNSLIRLPQDKLAIIQGLDGYLVTEEDGILIICHKDQDQQFRDFIADVKSKKGEKYL